MALRTKQTSHIVSSKLKYQNGSEKRSHLITQMPDSSVVWSEEANAPPPINPGSIPRHCNVVHFEYWTLVNVISAKWESILRPFEAKTHVLQTTPICYANCYAFFVVLRSLVGTDLLRFLLRWRLRQLTCSKFAEMRCTACALLESKPKFCKIDLVHHPCNSVTFSIPCVGGWNKHLETATISPDRAG